MRKVAKYPISLETRVGEDADATLGDMVEDSSTTSPSDAAVHAIMQTAVNEAFDGLPPREAKVFAYALRNRCSIRLHASEPFRQAKRISRSLRVGRLVSDSTQLLQEQQLTHFGVALVPFFA